MKPKVYLNVGNNPDLDKPQHTPTPWDAIETGMDELEETFEISSMKTDGSSGGYRWFNRADATFLVRAVNCHEELLAIVKEIYDNENDIARRKHSDEMRFRMEEAIASAEGK